jgi:hypothetical protein
MAMVLVTTFLISFMGCATANNVPELERIPNKFDGRWKLDSNSAFYMKFNIKYGKIVGRMGITSWPADIHLPIRGEVSQDGEFKFEYAGSMDVSNGFDLEVKNASAEKGFIEGYAIDDFNKRYTWKVFRK